VEREGDGRRGARTVQVGMNQDMKTMHSRHLPSAEVVSYESTAISQYANDNASLDVVRLIEKRHTDHADFAELFAPRRSEHISDQCRNPSLEL
jgi:hypothetical protein